MADKQEKIRAWELQKMAEKIYFPSTFYSSQEDFKTVCDKMNLVWKSFQTAVYTNNSMTRVPKSGSEYTQLSEIFDEAVKDFWLCYTDGFSQNAPRPKYYHFHKIANEK